MYFVPLFVFEHKLFAEEIVRNDYYHGGDKLCCQLVDVKLFAENAPAGLRIKAAGGIKTLDDAELFLNLGAERLGTSRVVKIIKSEENVTGY